MLDFATVDRWTAPLAEPPPSARSARYRGDDRAVPLEALPTEDAVAIRELYAMLLAFAEALAIEPTAAIAAFPLDRAFETSRMLGRSNGLSTPVRHALHDVRGGALTSFVVELQRARRRPDAARPRALHILAADRLKMMRNALLGLDDEKRERDLVPCLHAVDRLVESLTRVRTEDVSVRVECRFHGAITASCLELGALDRAALNLVNNATRHARDEDVHVTLGPTAAGDLRIVVANAVAPAQTELLAARYGEELGELFLEPFSTTGSGDGLKICVDFVAAAYGLAAPREAVSLSLVGARLVEGSFVAWLHWPSIA